MKISSSPDDEIITYALGSCLGITVYDPVARIGAMVHVMLPSSSIDPVKASMNPCMFVDTGVKNLFLASYKAGAQRSRLIVVGAGGACANGMEQDDYFQIGKRNVTVLRSLLWKNGIILKNCDFGGNLARTMSLDIATGQVLIKMNGVTEILSGECGGGSLK
ncbi:MAG: chemotaxis protein CheD [Acidobacteria bacterium]|nr:chemotaxis protein CheD [Acidobacteriota bacterium]